LPIHGSADSDAGNGFDRRHDGIYKIVSTLRKAQGEVTYATPSVADITKAISASAKAQASAGPQSIAFANRLELLAFSTDASDFDTRASIARLPGMAIGGYRFSRAQAVAKQAIQPGLVSAIARALQLPSDMDACVAAFAQ
jgi:hypothetical protein